MFVDKAIVSIRAGKGGDGAISFRHEKYVDKGGPDGGDGGDGGDVIAVASLNQNTLANFRHNKLLFAKPGSNGGKRKRHGKNGQNLYIKVPVGTVISKNSGDQIADMLFDGQEEIIAFGGKGGFGNAHFVSSVRQTPRVAEKGEEGDELEVTLELKMIADVGLVGLPNAGKSTLLGAISNAKPEVADYPFTTLNPYLGVVDSGDESFLVADIPGLIEGASEGKGLGDDFLRHIERTSVVWHLIDGYHEDIAQAYSTIIKELGAYKVDITKKPEIVVITKIDGLDEDIIKDQKNKLKKVTKSPIIAVSSKSKEGLDELLKKASKVIEKSRSKTKKQNEEKAIPIIKLGEAQLSWKVEKKKDYFFVSGKKIERFASRTDFDSDQGIARLRDIMKKMGIFHELRRQGVESGDIIIIGKHSGHQLIY